MSAAATVAALGAADLRRCLNRGGLRFQVGPYVYAVTSPLPVVARGLELLYAGHPLAPAESFVDFNIALRPAGPWQRLARRINFYLDDDAPFERIAASDAYAFLEWGMNWCLSVAMHEYLKLHAAVVARDGVAMVLPGLPGAGKSTLCAALALRGWQVLSDEHALIPPGTCQVVPVNRPVSLKNASIEVIRAFEPASVFGPVTRDTHKGRVAHLKSDLAPGSHDPTPIRVGVMLFPGYEPGAALSLTERSRAESFIFAAHHSFNFSVLGEAGFEAMAHYVDGVDCFDLRYSDLDEAVAALDTLVSGGFGA